MELIDTLIWRIVMSDKATLSEVREEWTYLDVYTCIFLLDQDVIYSWMANKPRPTDGNS